MRQATAYRRMEHLFVHSSSRTTDGVWILSEPCIKLDEECTDGDLGAAVQACLQGSRTGVPHPTSWGHLLDPLLVLAGEKSWGTLAWREGVGSGHARSNPGDTAMSSENKRMIHGDCWKGVLNEEWHVDATWEDVERALNRLDAHEYTIIAIQADGEAHLVIGGGAGHYVVYATFDNNEFWNLLSAQTSARVVLLNVGGQEGDYLTKQVVTVDLAVAAAKTFFLHGELDPSLLWERQS
jgi:Immunity protein Imm1